MYTDSTGLSDAGTAKQSSGKQQLKGSKKRKRGDADGAAGEFGVTRGIDFKGVRTVVNIDLPADISG